MEMKCCPICKTMIEKKDRYEDRGEMFEEFIEPCNTCKNCNSDENEIPCAFCVHME